MKLKTLAAAIAVASMPFAAHSAANVSGDIGVGYFVNGAGDGSFDESGSEINIDASEKVGGLTYFAHLEMDLQGDGGAPNVSFEELRLGVKGGFGEVRIGHTGDPGCGLVQTGGSYEIWKTHSKGGCSGSADGISYKRSFGPATGAISYSPEADSGDGEISVGLSGKVGPVTASIGHTTGEHDRTSFALRGGFGPVEAGMRYGKSDGGEAQHGINLRYKTASGIHVYGGVETGDSGADDKEMSFGVKKVIGKTDFAIEMHDSGASDDNVSYVIGARHRF